MPTDVTKNYRWKRVRSGRGCAKGSFRVKKTSSGVLLRFCCPRGKFKRGQCAGGMKLQAKAKPKSRALGEVAYPKASSIRLVRLKRR